MPYILMIREFFSDVPFLGWFIISPLALTGGVLFWNFLSFLIVLGQRLICGKFFISPGQKRLFLIGAGGTTGIQLLIYIYVGYVYFTDHLLRDCGFPVIYFLSLALLLIAAVHFFILLISSVVGRFKARRGRTV